MGGVGGVWNQKWHCISYFKMLCMVLFCPMQKNVVKVQFGVEKGGWNGKIWIQWSWQQEKNRQSSNFIQIKLVSQIWHFSLHKMWKEIKNDHRNCFFFFYNETNDSLRGDPPHPSIRRDVVYIAALERGYGSKKKRNIKELIEPINLKHLFKD